MVRGSQRQASVSYYHFKVFSLFLKHTKTGGLALRSRAVSALQWQLPPRQEGELTMPVVNYLWNPLNDNIAREFDDAGTVIAEYTTEANQFGNVVSQRRSGQDSVYHYDGQGSTLALTNANGDVTDTYAYSAFGEVTAHTGSTVNPFQYIGQRGYYWDQETGQCDIRHRQLTQNGRWLSRDPLLPRTLSSHYPYVLNQPVSYIDPSGTAPVAGGNVVYGPWPTLGFGKVYTPRTVSKCSEWRWSLSWRINNPRKYEKGAIIQKITLTKYFINACNTKAIMPPGPALTRLCEIWPVSSLIPWGFEISPKNDDTFVIKNPFGPPNRNYGTTTIKGEAVYVPDYFTVIGYPWVEPGNIFHPGGTEGLAAMDCELPNKGPKVTHTLSVDWDCCCKPPYDFVSSKPSPTTTEITPKGE
jgi:RHS repeat-associated protein